jgi:hypothetical protein
VEFFIAEIVLLSTRLDFHKATCSSHHDIHIDLGVPILGVVQIEKGHLIDEAHANRGDRSAYRVSGHFSRELQAFDGTAKSEARPSDRSGAGSSIRGENIAIDPEASRT